MKKDKSLIEKAENFVRKTFEEKVSDDYSYHSIDHSIMVRDAVIELCNRANLSNEEKEDTILAALFHDIGFSKGAEDHEETGIKIAHEWLSKHGHPADRIARIERCIAATKKDAVPGSHMESILKDADLSNLSHNDYNKYSKKLRAELEKTEGMQCSKAEWRDVNIDFMKNHQYYSEEAKTLYRPQKLMNIEKLETKKSKKGKVEQPKTIATSKSAQTQFKTSLRNHIDLSAIADNKANIMLTVNALIITVGMPIIFELVEGNNNLIPPTALLLCVCVISMVFATLATRPLQTPGITNLSDIKNRNSNLFFFGNFYKMSLENYEDGVKQVVADDEIMDNSIIRDLYFSGKALGRKYDYLRKCYNIFMFGMVISIIAFVMAMII